MSLIAGYSEEQIRNAISDIYIVRMLVAKMIAFDAINAASASVTATAILDEQAREISRLLQLQQFPGVDPTVLNATIDSLHLAMERVFAQARAVAAQG